MSLALTKILIASLFVLAVATAANTTESSSAGSSELKSVDMAALLKSLGMNQQDLTELKASVKKKSDNANTNDLTAASSTENPGVISVASG